MLSSKPEARHLMARLAMRNAWPLVFAAVLSRQPSSLVHPLRNGMTIPDDPPRVDQTWNPAQDGQADVDEEIGTASALQEDCQLKKMLATRVLRSRPCKERRSQEG